MTPRCCIAAFETATIAQMQTFPITQVHALRTAAASVCGEPGDAPLGWSVSRLDPMEMLALFDALWLRAGFGVAGLSVAVPREWSRSRLGAADRGGVSGAGTGAGQGVGRSAAAAGRGAR